jgi:hypothetical protein
LPGTTTCTVPLRLSGPALEERVPGNGIRTLGTGGVGRGGQGPGQERGEKGGQEQAEEAGGFHGSSLAGVSVRAAPTLRWETMCLVRDRALTAASAQAAQQWSTRPTGADDAIPEPSGR